MVRMNKDMGRKTSNKNRDGAWWVGAALLLSVGQVLVGCGPQESLPPGNSEAGPMASYRGMMVPMAQLFETMESVSCEDHLGPGLITCYDSREEMLQKIHLGAVSAQSCGGPGTLYATLWEHADFAGSSLMLFQDYNHLGVIGWNDKVSSVMLHSGCSAVLYHHINYNPDGQVVYTNSEGWVGDSNNDMFSSVRRGN